MLDPNDVKAMASSMCFDLCSYDQAKQSAILLEATMVKIASSIETLKICFNVVTFVFITCITISLMVFGYYFWKTGHLTKPNKVSNVDPQQPDSDNRVEHLMPPVASPVANSDIGESPYHLSHRPVTPVQSPPPTLTNRPATARQAFGDRPATARPPVPSAFVGGQDDTLFVRPQSRGPSPIGEPLYQRNLSGSLEDMKDDGTASC